jgi:hypothetical protein
MRTTVWPPELTPGRVRPASPACAQRRLWLTEFRDGVPPRGLWPHGALFVVAPLRGQWLAGRSDQPAVDMPRKSSTEQARIVQLLAERVDEREDWLEKRIR